MHASVRLPLKRAILGGIPMEFITSNLFGALLVGRRCPRRSDSCLYQPKRRWQSAEDKHMHDHWTKEVACLSCLLSLSLDCLSLTWLSLVALLSLSLGTFWLSLISSHHSLVSSLPLISSRLVQK